MKPHSQNRDLLTEQEGSSDRTTGQRLQKVSGGNLALQACFYYSSVQKRPTCKPVTRDLKEDVKKSDSDPLAICKSVFGHFWK